MLLETIMQMPILTITMVIKKNLLLTRLVAMLRNIKTFDNNKKHM